MLLCWSLQMTSLRKGVSCALRSCTLFLTSNIETVKGLIAYYCSLSSCWAMYLCLRFSPFRNPCCFFVHLPYSVIFNLSTQIVIHNSATKPRSSMDSSSSSRSKHSRSHEKWTSVSSTTYVWDITFFSTYVCSTDWLYVDLNKSSQ